MNQIYGLELCKAISVEVATQSGQELSLKNRQFKMTALQFSKQNHDKKLTSISTLYTLYNIISSIAQYLFALRRVNCKKLFIILAVTNGLFLFPGDALFWHKKAGLKHLNSSNNFCFTSGLQISGIIISECLIKVKLNFAKG